MRSSSSPLAKFNQPSGASVVEVTQLLDTSFLLTVFIDKNDVFIFFSKFFSLILINFISQRVQSSDSPLCLLFFLFVFHAILTTTNNHQIGSSFISYYSPFIRNSNDVKNFSQCPEKPVGTKLSIFGLISS